MAKTDFKSVDEDIASQLEAVRSVLKQVRSTIRRALPRAEQVISYQIPAYTLHGRPVAEREKAVQKKVTFESR